MKEVLAWDNKGVLLGEFAPWLEKEDEEFAAFRDLKVSSEVTKDKILLNLCIPRPTELLENPDSKNPAIEENPAPDTEP